MPTQIASDNFNRANGGLGSNWTGAPDEGATPTITSNQVTGSDGTDGAAFWNANTFHTDHYSQITISTASDYEGVIVRATASDVIYGQNVGATGDMVIYWYNGGAYTQIGSTYTTSGFSNGDVAYLEADGSTFTLKQNGTTRVTGTNASAPVNGSPGLLVSDTTCRLDNWSGGNLYDNGIIAFASAEESPTSGTLDVSLTIPTGYSNLVLVVTTQIRDATDADRNITGIVWNTSESLTQAKEQNDDTLDLTTEIWHRVAPTTGTHTVSATTAGTCDRTRITAICLAGTAQTGLPDATGGASGTSTTPSTSVTTVLNNCIVIDSVFDKFEANPSPGSGQTSLDSTTVASVADGVGTSYERKATAGSVTMSWTSSIDDWCIAAASYPVYTAPAVSNSSTFLMMGI